VEYDSGTVDQTRDLVPNRVPWKIARVFRLMPDRNVVTVVAVERQTEAGDVVHGPNTVTGFATIVEVFVWIDTIIESRGLEVERAKLALDADIDELLDLSYRLDKMKPIIVEPGPSDRDPVVHPLQKHRPTLQRNS